MNYQPDIAEIVRFSECGIDASLSGNAKNCIGRFTETTQDSF